MDFLTRPAHSIEWHWQSRYGRSIVHHCYRPSHRRTVESTSTNAYTQLPTEATFSGRHVLTMMTTIHDDLCIEYSLLKSHNTFQIIFGNGHIFLCFISVFNIEASAVGAQCWRRQDRRHSMPHSLSLPWMAIYIVVRSVVVLICGTSSIVPKHFPHFSLRHSRNRCAVQFVEQFHVLSLIFHLTSDQLKFLAEARWDFFLSLCRSLSLYLSSLGCICCLACSSLWVLRLWFLFLYSGCCYVEKSLLFQAYHTSHLYTLQYI